MHVTLKFKYPSSPALFRVEGDDSPDQGIDSLEREIPGAALFGFIGLEKPPVAALGVEALQDS